MTGTVEKTQLGERRHRTECLFCIVVCHFTDLGYELLRFKLDSFFFIYSAFSTIGSYCNWDTSHFFIMILRCITFHHVSYVALHFYWPHLLCSRQCTEAYNCGQYSLSSYYTPSRIWRISEVHQSGKNRVDGSRFKLNKNESIADAIKYGH